MKTNLYPDDFMFEVFNMCSSIYHSNKRENYLMLSSGANVLSMTKMWERLCELEIKNNFMYSWYTSPSGFPCLTSFIKLYYNFMAAKGKYNLAIESYTCSTLGASQAAAIAFKYVKKINSHVNALLVGFNYSLFERLCRFNDFSFYETNNKNGTNLLPNLEMVIENIENKKINFVIMTLPNNPSGEMWKEDDLRKFISYIKSKSITILIDIVPQIYITNRRIINIENIIYEESALDNVILINSFSKSEGVPGFRAGYVLGNKSLYDFACDYQINDSMNPPTVPIFPIIFTLIFRCIFVGLKNKWICEKSISKLLKDSRQIIDMTCAIPDKNFIQNIYEYLNEDTFLELYYEYINEQMYREKVIMNNYSYLLEELIEHIELKTELVNGFNIMIKLKKLNKCDELEFMKHLLDKTSISILTSSCFSLNSNDNMWIRISCAMDSKQFKEAVDKFKKYIEEYYE